MESMLSKLLVIRAWFKTCRYRVARESCHSERSEESQSGGYQMPEIPRRYAPRNDTLGCYPVLNHAVIPVQTGIQFRPGYYWIPAFRRRSRSYGGQVAGM